MTNTTLATSTSTSTSRSIQRANQATWIRESGTLVDAIAHSMAYALVRRTMQVLALELPDRFAQPGLTRAERRTLCRARLDEVARRGMAQDQWLASLPAGSIAAVHAGGEAHVQRVMQQAAASVRSLVDASIDDFIATAPAPGGGFPVSPEPRLRTSRKVSGNV